MSQREKRAARRSEKDANRLFKEHHRGESERLQRVLAAAGHEMTVQGAEVVWMHYSEDEYAAGWMGMPESDAELLNEALKYVC